MDRNPYYGIVKKEKSPLSFLLEKPQPKEILLCGEPLEILELPDFAGEKEKGIVSAIKRKLYETLYRRKIRKLPRLITKELPVSIVEACLAEFLKKECAFRRTTKILVADKSRVDFKSLLMPYCSSLNYLEFLVEDKEDYEYLAEEMYEESGLAVTFTALEEEAEAVYCGGYHIVIDMKKDFHIPSENLAKGCVYFDGFSDSDKEKQIRRQQMGITYISPGIYLDRALRSTV